MHALLSTRTFHSLLFVMTLAATALPAPRALAQTTWINAGSGNWNTNANWSPAVFPDAMDVDVVFDPVNPAANSTITLTADVTIGTLTIDNPTTSTITGQTITFNDSNSAFIAFNDGNWTIDSNIQLDSNLTLNGAAGGTIGGVIADGAASSLTKTGSGTVHLDGDNTLTGTVSVNQGTLVLNNGLGSGETLGDISQLNLSGSSMLRLGATGTINDAAALSMSGNSTLDLDGFTEQVASLAGTSGTAISMDGGTFVVSGGATTTYAGSISGGGEFRHIGSGTLTLSGTNPFSGETDVTDGILRLAAPGALGSTSDILVQGDGILRLAANGTINNSAGVTLGATATFDLDGNTESIATLDGSAGTSVTLGSGGHLQVNDNVNSTYAGVISGDGSFAKSGTGTMQLDGANTFTGDTRIDDGILRLDAVNALGGTSQITLNNDAILRNNTAGSVINDDAALVLNDTSSFELNGDFEAVGSLAGGTDTTVLLGADTLATGGNDASTTYSGVLSGAGGSLTKNGTGTFSLGGINTYTGPTTINSGRLDVNGSITSAVTATLDSTLGGTGSVESATINDGATVAPGNSIGTLTVAGNGTPAFTQLAGSTYEVEINDGGTTAGVNSDLIDLTSGVSTASLDGTVDVVSLTGTLGDNYAAGSTYTILQTANPNGVTGAYSGVTDNLFLRDGLLIHNSDNVQMQLLRVSGDFEAKGLTRNQKNVGEVLDEETPLATGDFGDGLDQLVFLALTDPAQIPGVLDTLGGEVHASVGGHMVQQTSRFVDMISRRLRSNSPGAVGMYGPTVAPGAPLLGSNTNQGLQRVSMTDAGDFVVRAQGIGSPAWGSAYALPSYGQPLGGLWVGGYGVTGDVDGDGNGNPYDYDMFGTTFGIERQVAPALLLGLVGGYGRSQVDMSTPSADADVDSYHAGMYAHFNEGIFYSSAVVAYGYQQYDTTRRIPFFGLTANGDYDGQQFVAYGEKGLNLCFGGLRVQPLVGLQFIALERDAFTETGAGPFNLTAGKDHVNSLRLSAGGRIAPELPEGFFGAIIPEIRGRWVHEFKDDTQALSAAFAGAPGNNFAVTSPELGRNFGIVGAGITAQLSPLVNLYLDYDFTFSSSLEAHAGSGGLEFLW